MAADRVAGDAEHAGSGAHREPLQLCVADGLAARLLPRGGWAERLDPDLRRGAVCDESVAAVWRGLRKVERAIGDLQAASAIGDGEGGRGRIGSRRARGGLAMTTTVKATYANGVLTPEEPLDLMEGARVTVSIEGAPPTGGGLGAIVEAVKELHKSIPEDAWDVLPTDLAKNKKHYLYGHPKEDD